MQKIYRPIIPGMIFIFCLVIFFNFTNKDIKSPAIEIKKNYLHDFEKYVTAVKVLYKNISAFENKNITSKNLQEAFLTARKSYKKIEYLAAHLSPEFVKNYINGPPLLSLEPNSPSLSILEPEGFQIMEENIFVPEEEIDLKFVGSLAESLLARSEELQKIQQNIYLTDRLVLEGTRFELIRIFSLGLAGFDSPHTDKAIIENLHAWQSIGRAIERYLALIKDENPELAENLEENLKGGATYLDKNQSFESFDRLYFLKKFVNPVYGQVLDLQLMLGIETYYETTPLYKKHPVNYLSRNIFANDFLNPYYYMQLSKRYDNEYTQQLGKMLFFDPVLSDNNERACASCHIPEKGFTDGREKSLAMNFEGTVDRNAMGLVNAVYADRFFYDMRADILENQIDHVITDSREFHTTYMVIFDKLQQSEEYVAMFKKAFPEMKHDPINKNTIAAALSAYIKSLSTFNSDFDLYVRGETTSIDEEVIKGFNIFMGKGACGTCHFAPTFAGLVPPAFRESESEVLGVPATTDTINPQMDADPGRFAGQMREQADFYKHSFKTTTIRNAALTAPYMHNGVYHTLDEVVDFYNKGGGEGLGMKVPYQTLPPDPLELTSEEKKALVKFMQSLTDTTGITNRPKHLPLFPANLSLNERKIGGRY